MLPRPSPVISADGINIAGRDTVPVIGANASAGGTGGPPAD